MRVETNNNNSFKVLAPSLP